MTTVFESWQRHDRDPARHGEALSGFLDRVDQPLFGRVRDLINEWVRHLPGDAAADIAARLRSRSGDVFRAAFWELYLHEFLCRSGFEVEVHPVLPGTTRVPDFRAARAEHMIIIEATAVGTADTDRARDARRSRLHDQLNKVASPNYFLWLDIELEGKSDVPGQGLRAGLEPWLATLDPDYVSQQMALAGGIDAMPRYVYEGGGWRISIGAYPKSPTGRGDPDLRPLGIYGSQAQWIDDRSPLLRRLKRKSSAYGHLDVPYVIAVSGSTFTTDTDDILSALFGSDQVTVAFGDDGAPPRSWPSRGTDGFWITPAGISRTHVSAVLFVPYVEPWQVGTIAPVLVHHPRADHPLELPSPYLRTCTVGERVELIWTDPTRSAWELFDLPTDWPGPEPAFV